MADRENDNEPEAQRQDDENGVNDGNLSDESDDGLDAASDTSYLSDDGLGRGLFYCISNFVLDGNKVTCNSVIPINQERVGERVLRLYTNEIDHRWDDSKYNPTCHKGRLEVGLENGTHVTIKPRSGLTVNDVLLRKVDNGLEIEFPE